MPSSKAKLALRPERCDGCGRCERACPRGALRVGPGYLFVDWAACDACAACAEACDRSAIERPTSLPQRSRGAPAGGIAGGIAREARTPRAAAAPGTWSLPEAVAALAAMLALFVAEEAALVSGAVSEMSPGAAAAARLLVLGVYYTAQLGLVYALAARRGLGLARAFRLTGERTSVAHKLSSVALSAGMLVLTVAVMVGWGRLTRLAGWHPPERWSTDVTTLFGAEVGGFVFTVAMVVVLGPLVEELVFRGIVLSAIGERWGPAAGVLGSAAVFGAFHFSAWQFVPAAVLGLALGSLTLRRRSLWPAIALHCSYNGVVVLAAFWLASRAG